MAEASIASFKHWNPNAKIIVVSEKPLPIKCDQNITIQLPKKYKNRGLSDRITNAAYLKLYLTQLPFNKVLYVDPDTICQKPLLDFYNTNIKYIGLTESHSFGIRQARELGLEKYGITGMMLMNLEELRKIDFTSRCLQVESEFKLSPKLWRHDETCINLGMRGLLTFFDVKYNYCHNRIYDNPIPEKDAYILHYVGKDKSDMPKIDRYPEIAEIGEHIKGKSVAIVGNARSIFSKKNGEKIDNHDFIIRFNKGFICDEKSQGKRTDLLLLACEPTPEEIDLYNARFVCNRSKHYHNRTKYTITNTQRQIMKDTIGKQPSTGFMAVDICLNFGAKSIDLFGFDFEATPTYYNPVGYVTQHDYSKEEEIIKGYEKQGKLRIL